MDITISFLTTKWLPQLGYFDNKDTCSNSFVLFQSLAQDKHFITDCPALHVGCDILIILFSGMFSK